ncbi:hypothetical protein SDC9_162044 [bioreactor metagenome]|uniref:Uncharacterized protein n=1 Tax=bioreactor metagenome TaxID=1076179 RepID=A0A645FJZ0_9ZZZZ
MPVAGDLGPRAGGRAGESDGGALAEGGDDRVRRGRAGADVQVDGGHRSAGRPGDCRGGGAGVATDVAAGDVDLPAVEVHRRPAVDRVAQCGDPLTGAQATDDRVGEPGPRPQIHPGGGGQPVTLCRLRECTEDHARRCDESGHRHCRDGPPEGANKEAHESSPPGDLPEPP